MRPFRPLLSCTLRFGAIPLQITDVYWPENERAVICMTPRFAGDGCDDCLSQKDGALQEMPRVILEAFAFFA